eukprot:scaffold3600_cov387-Prasinococcus_capsulatus_cf.AAC.6
MSHGRRRPWPGLHLTGQSGAWLSGCSGAGGAGELACGCPKLSVALIHTHTPHGGPRCDIGAQDRRGPSRRPRGIVHVKQQTPPRDPIRGADGRGETLGAGAPRPASRCAELLRARAVAGAMASAWQPNEEGVRRITTLLQEYLQPGADQARLFQELEQCKQFPDFNNYLAFVLCLGQDYNVQVRQSAGLLLKNNLRGWESTAPEFRSYMRDSLLQCVRCSERMLRQTAGTVISTIVHLCGSKDFLQLFALFLSADAQNEADALDGYLDTIFKIGEEASYRLAETVDGMPQSPADAIVPRLLQLMASPHPNQRKKALGSLNYLLYCMPKSLFDRLDAFLQGLFSLSTDPNNDIRKLVSSGLVQMLELSPQSLQPHIHQVMEYMLNASQDGDQDVALESSEFWSAFCQNQLPAQLLWEYVPRLVPVLLKNMVYDDDDEAVINAQAEEEGLLQSTASDQDLKPFIPQGKNKGGEAEGEEEDDDFIAVWNLRKSSAAGLDILSNTFGKELLPALLPPVQQNLNSTDWKVRESAVLTIGAIAEGCYDGLVPHLGGLIPFLVPMLEDQRPLVRSITCWSISRYTAWLVSDGKQVLDGVVDGLMKRTLDRNKTVQEAACSALATITEEAGSLMTPHVNSIVQCLIVALTNYGKRSLRNLYDALGTLAESVGDTLGTQQYMNAILPPLFAKWTELGELDRELLPLLACVTSMVPAFARHIAVFAEGLYTQCLKILSVHLQLQQGNDPRFDRDFVISALDLLGSLGEALGMDTIPCLLLPPGGRERRAGGNTDRLGIAWYRQ